MIIDHYDLHFTLWYTLDDEYDFIDGYDDIYEDCDDINCQNRYWYLIQFRPEFTVEDDPKDWYK